MAGLIVLLLAALASVAVPRILQPGLAGVPAAAPLPPPPAVGTCMAVAERTRTIVPCSHPHHLEITATWPADDPTSPVRGDRDTCAKAGDEYTGVNADPNAALWSPATIRPDTARIRAPRGERAGQRGWVACTIQPWTYEHYVGSIRATGPGRSRPAAYGSCAIWGAPATCTKAHDAELLGVTTGFIPDAPGTDVLRKPAVPDSLIAELTGYCGDLARQLTGAADPTYAGQLEISLLPDAWRGTNDVFEGSTSTDYPGIYYFGSCLLHAPEGLLVGSVVGLGDAPVPFAS